MERRAAAAQLRELAPWLVLALVWAAFVWARYGGPYAASDDSYIYLGYVKRALTSPHELFSYNPGEHSAGITGMLYYYALVLVCGLVRVIVPSARLETVLLVGSFLANAALLLLAAHLYLRCWRRLVADGSRSGVLALGLAFLLFCADPKWLWAVFAGFEGPLAACLALAVLDRLLARAPAWQASVAASLLVATRPETMLLAWLLPALAVVAATRRLSLRGALVAYATAAACLVALVVPCYALTGHLFPSSLGTRVQLGALLDPSSRSLDLRSLEPGYWLCEWWLLAGVGLLAGVAVGLRTGHWTVARLFGVVLSFLVLRVGAGLASFNVEDRYVSYLWPLYALGVAACAGEVLRLAPALGASLRPAGATTPLTLAVYALTALVPIREFVLRTSEHVAIMNAIVVEPSRWMRTRLPADARVCMEPAGAIRVFTDFYLVDAIGLTTDHARTQAGNFADFLHDNGVGWVFDRPSHVGNLLLRGRAARDVAAFGRGQPWSDLHLYELDLSAAITLARLATEPVVPGRAYAVFDNNPAPGWSALVGGGPGFADGNAPEALVAEFAAPARVEALVVALSGVEDRTRAREAAARWAFEGEAGAGWTRLATRTPRVELRGRDRVLCTYVLAEPAELSGVRVVHEAGADGELDELTLLHGGRPFVWLWGDAIAARP